MDSSRKNENDVINYSPSCLSKPVRILFIFGTQIKIFLMKSESFLTTFKAEKASKDISKIVHMTSMVQPYFYKATRILFVFKENKKNEFDHSLSSVPVFAARSAFKGHLFSQSTQY